MILDQNNSENFSNSSNSSKSEEKKIGKVSISSTFYMRLLRQYFCAKNYKAVRN